MSIEIDHGQTSDEPGRKQLTLRRESLRELSNAELSLVAGGNTQRETDTCAVRSDD